MKLRTILLLLALCFPVYAQTYQQTVTVSGTSHTFTNAQSGRQYIFTSGSSVAVALPQAGASSLFRAGWYVEVKVTGAGTVTITPTTSTIGGAASLALATGASVKISSNGTNYLVSRLDISDAQRTTLADSDTAAWAAKTAPSGTVVGTTDSQTLTNKLVDGDDNTVQDLPYSAIKSTSRSGNGAKVATVTGTLTDGRCVQIDSAGNLVQASGACGTTSITAGAYGASDESLPTVVANGFVKNTDTDRLFVGSEDGTTWREVFTNGVSGPINVANGGLGVATITGLMQGNGTSPVTAITNSTTVGQTLRVTGSNTYGWGALDLADGDAVTGVLPSANMEAASESAKGAIEIATTAEIDTGTDALRAVAPDQFVASIYGEQVIQLVVLDTATAATTGDGKFYFIVPSKLNGMNLIAVSAQVNAVGTTSTLNVDIARCALVATGNMCSGTVVDVLSTNLTIDSNENKSSTAAAAAVIDTSNDDVATDQVIRIDIDAIHTTPSSGLIITLSFRKP